MIGKTLALTGALVAFTSVAHAQVMVIGGGMAKDCYEAAKKSGDNPQRAEKICDQALQQEALTRNNRAATYTNRGILRMRSGGYEKALEDYQNALKIQPGLGTTYLNMGAAHIYAKDWGKAKEALDAALARNTDQPFAAYYNRAIARENQGDLQGAYNDFKKALELKPGWERAEWQISRFTVTNG